MDTCGVKHKVMLALPVKNYFKYSNNTEVHILNIKIRPEVTAHCISYSTYVRRVVEYTSYQW